MRHEPFLTSTAAAFGVGRSALQGPEWRHVFRDVWVHRDVPDNREMRVRAVKLVMAPDAFLCGITPAWLHGIDPWDPRSDRVWIGAPVGRRPRARPGCLVREVTVSPGDLFVVDGLVTTVPVRTAFDCARWLSKSEGLVVADSLAHLGLITAAGLASYVESHRGVRNVRQADFVVARLDFAYPDLKVAVEYDGAQHWEERRRDDRRRDALRALGWTVIVLSASDLYRTPAQTIAKIGGALTQAASGRP